MTYRDPNPTPPLEQPAPRPKGTPDDPHPYGHGRWRCPKCGLSIAFGPVLRVHTNTVLSATHVRIEGPSCVWYTRTYEASRPEPKAYRTIQEDHLRTEVYVGRVFLGLVILVGFLHVCLSHT